MPNIHSENINNILVVGKNNQVGDMLCSLPMYAALKKKFLAAQITLVTAKTNYFIPVKELNPYIDEIITLDRATLKTTLSFLKELRKEKYQIGIVPSTITVSSTSHIVNYLSGAKIRVGVKKNNGIKNKTAYLLNVKKGFDWDKEKKHQRERNLDVVKQIGCDLSKEELKKVTVNIDEESLSFAEEYLLNNFPQKDKVIIGIHPGAGKKENIWSIDNFKSLINKLNEKYHSYFLITAGQTDREIVEELNLYLNEKNIEYKTAENLNIKDLAAIIKNTRIYITNDTGPMHISDSVGAKTLALFGPTKSYEWGPTGEESFSIQSPTENINDISVDTVFNKATTMIEKK